jgi:2-oxoisovalerate dehydrogenase E2 component (dihydrolipoyl transacylase)
VIRAFDRVCEVQSDKATVEITSRFGGVVAKVYSVEGDVVKVSDGHSRHRTKPDIVSYSSSTPFNFRPAGWQHADRHPGGGRRRNKSPTATASSTQHTAATPAVEAHSRQAGITAPGKFLTAPAVRKIAKEHKLDLALVRASGPKGRIVKEDLLAFIAGKQTQQQQQQQQQQY